MQERNRQELLVLIAGPYRSGTNGEPEKLAANVRAMNEAALRVFKAGHLPVTGEALALPLIDLAGAPTSADAPGTPFSYVSSDLDHLELIASEVMPHL